SPPYQATHVLPPGTHISWPVTRYGFAEQHTTTRCRGRRRCSWHGECSIKSPSSNPGAEHQFADAAWSFSKLTDMTVLRSNPRQQPRQVQGNLAGEGRRRRWPGNLDTPK